jgi:hypothetical protein
MHIYETRVKLNQLTSNDQFIIFFFFKKSLKILWLGIKKNYKVKKKVKIKGMSQNALTQNTNGPPTKIAQTLELLLG